MNKQTTRWLCAGLFLLTPIAQAAAQGVNPDPAVVRQDHLRRLEQTAPAMPTPPLAAPRTQQAVAPESAASVTFTEVQFSQTALLSPEELRAIGQRYLGRALRTSDIQALLNEVSDLYRTKGILTATPVLPQQNLQSGVLRVLLVEGRLGRVKVRNPGDGDAEWVQRWFDLATDEVVTNEALTSRLARFNAASDLYASAEFIAGERFGVSDLAIDVIEGARSQFWTFAETTNASTDASGLLAVGWRMAPFSPTGGKLEAALLRSQQGVTLVGGTSWPWGVKGWRAGINGSASDTRTRVRSETEAQDLFIDGKSSAVTLEFGRTWVLSSPWVMGTGISWGTTRSRSSVANETLLDRRLDKLALTSTFDYETSQQRATLRASAATSKGGDGRFKHLDVSALVQTALDDSGRWHARANGMARLATSGQGSNADPIVLGGSDSVRGFDAGAVTGDKGSALQLELRHRTTFGGSPLGEVCAFVDSGQGYAEGSWQKIASMGLGFQAKISQNLGVDLVVSHQLKSEQAPRNRWLLRLVGSW